MTVQDYQMPQRSAEGLIYIVRQSFETPKTYEFRSPLEVINPTLTLIRGSTYTFNIEATNDPFWIKTAQVTGTGSAYNNGVTNNGAVRTVVNGVSTTGVVTFVVPTNAPNTLYYISQNSATMTGVFNIIDGIVGLPNTNISFSSIQEEYGGQNPISLNEYYSGGPYVPAAMSGFRGVVPSSGPISTEDLSRINLINIIGRQWSPSFLVDRGMGAINSQGQIFFTSVGYDNSLATWVMPTASFTANGQELWSSKLKFIFGTGIPYNNSTFSLNSGDFVIGGGNSPRTAGGKPGAFIVELKRDSLSYTDSLKIKKLWHPSNDLKAEHVHWVKDSNDQFFYMIALLTATNSFMVVKIQGPIQNMSPTSIVWAKRYQFGSSLNTYSQQRAGTIINYINSFLYVPAKNQIFVSFDLNYPASIGAENNNAFEIVGFDCNDGRIIKYVNYYTGSNTGGNPKTAKFARCVLTDSNSQGDIFGNYIYYTIGAQYGNEYMYSFKLPNRTVGDQNNQYDLDGYSFYTRDYSDTFAMNMGSFYYNNAWLTENKPVKSILINEDQPNFNPGSTLYQNADSKGEVINIWNQRMTPLNDDSTLTTITNGKVILINGSNSVPTGGRSTGLYAWYLKDNDFSITNQNLDLYNYSSVFQHPTNKRNIAFIAKTQNSSTTGQPQFIISVLPRFKQLKYYLPTVFYQKLGSPPRWPDVQQRPAELGYGKLIYGPTSRYNYDNSIYFRADDYYTWSWTVTNLTPSDFLFDTSAQANDWVGWSTGQGNPITKTSFYPTTTYESVPSTTTTFFATIATDQQQLNLRSWTIANGWNEINPVVIIISSSVVIWSDNTSIPALTIDGVWPNGISIINQGAIIGKGGRGYGPNGNATSGGPAISLGVNVSIHQEYRSDLNFYPMIAGGGGGGGGGAVFTKNTSYGVGGGGAGGGEFGALSLSVTSGVAPRTQGTGGNGGRVVSSTLGSGPTFGISAGGAYDGSPSPADGGAGGRAALSNQNLSGSGYALLNGDNGGNADGAGGGGYGANGGSGQTFGGAAGKAIQTNGYTVTFVQNVVGNPTIRVYGAVS